MIHCNALLLPNDYCLLKETKILFLQTGWYSFQIRWYSLSECESGKLWFSHSFLSRNYTIACKQLSSHNDTSEKEDWQGSTTLKKSVFCHGTISQLHAGIRTTRFTTTTKFSYRGEGTAQLTIACRLDSSSCTNTCQCQNNNNNKIATIALISRIVQLCKTLAKNQLLLSELPWNYLVWYTFQKCPW